MEAEVTDHVSSLDEISGLLEPVFGLMFVLVREKKKKPQKVIGIQDLKPKKDVKGGGKHISVTDIHRLLNIGISKSSR